LSTQRLTAFVKENMVLDFWFTSSRFAGCFCFPG
jgi:hypothetical protein